MESLKIAYKNRQQISALSLLADVRKGVTFKLDMTGDVAVNDRQHQQSERFQY